MDPFVYRHSLSNPRKIDPKGEKGNRGLQGELGPQGPKGEKGPQGDIGPVGQKGEQGIKGDKGDQGQSGASTNWRGEWAPKAEYSINDAVGYEGSSYICIVDNVSSGENKPGDEKYWQLLAKKGDPGAQGPKGIDGQPGEDGLPGETGPAGPQGDIGPQGIQGTQGLQGEVGPTGEVGPQGPTGPEGDVGPQGPMGFIGPQGDTGPQGPQGEQGEQGYFIEYVLYAGPVVSGDYIYFAKEKIDGNWVIIREEIATTIKTFASGVSGIVAAWADKEGQTYQLFSV